MRFNTVSRRRVQIGLTPLIDVVFILLIFFMLATNFLDLHSIALNTPAAERRASNQTLSRPLLIVLSPDGSLLVDRQTLTEAQMMAYLRRRLAQQPDAKIILRPAPTTPLQQLITLLDTLNVGGISDITLSTPQGAGQ